MDYLFVDNLSNTPKDKVLSSVYLVDKELRYVSFSNSDCYYLFYVDVDKVSDLIMESDNEYTFDYYVLKQCCPIVSQCSKYDVNNDTTLRTITIKTLSGNFYYKKPKKYKDNTVIIKCKDNYKKLF